MATKTPNQENDNHENNEIADLIVKGAKQVTIELSEPIVRGSKDAPQTISKFTITKPLGGALRGLSVNAVAQGDYDALSVLIPRITNPQILANDLHNMGFDDVTAITGVMTAFLLSSKAKLAGSI